MKNWQKILITTAAFIYLDKELIPWAKVYISYIPQVRDRLKRAVSLGSETEEKISQHKDDITNS